MRRAVKAYWWKDVPNFGDGLAPLLLEHFAGVNVTWAPISQASVVSVGSVLEHIPLSWSGYILGSGRLKEKSHVHLAHATVLALRGPLSARGIDGNFSFGDPGLLADELVGPQETQWDLGIVPHWRDTKLAVRFKALIRAPHTTHVIDPRQDPLEVMRQIGSCRRIVTSSLHGMIAADAFGLPRRLEISSQMASIHEGGDFKFRDYCASIHTQFEPGVMTEPSRWSIEDAKYNIFDAYKVLEEALA
jgi:pyruvyltransferase